MNETVKSKLKICYYSRMWLHILLLQGFSGSPGLPGMDGIPGIDGSKGKLQYAFTLRILY